MNSASKRPVSKKTLPAIADNTTSSPMAILPTTSMPFHTTHWFFSGAYGHGLISNIFFGSKMEIAQSTPDQQHAGQRAEYQDLFELIRLQICSQGLDGNCKQTLEGAGKICPLIRSRIARQLFIFCMGVALLFSERPLLADDANLREMQTTTEFSYRTGPGDASDIARALALYGAKYKAVLWMARQLAARDC